MIYALNVYDVIASKIDLYAEYAAGAAAQMEGFDITVVAAGDEPIREIRGRTRNHFALVQFADVGTFDAFMERLDAHDLHRLREASTENYLWTLYQSWAFG